MIDLDRLRENLEQKIADHAKLHGPVETPLGEMYWRQPSGAEQDKIFRAVDKHGQVYSLAMGIVIRARDDSGRRIFSDADIDRWMSAGLENIMEMLRCLGVDYQPATVDDMGNSSS